MDADVLKALKAMREQINDTNSRMEMFLLDKHNNNSEAIDDITISLLEENKNV